MYCPQCRQQVPEGTARCPHCKLVIVFPAGPPITQPYVAPLIEDDAVTRLLLPVGRSAWAIAAGYAGLLSPICLVAPLAVILGVIALTDISKHPERRGRGRAIFAIIMGSIFSIGLLIMVLMMLTQWRVFS